MKFLLFILIIGTAMSVRADVSSLNKEVGQMMMVGLSDTVISENSEIVQEIKTYHIGGVILDNQHQTPSKLYLKNIINPAQLKKLLSDLQYYAKKYNDYPLFIAINQEGGMIRTLRPANGFATDKELSQNALGIANNQKEIFNQTYQKALLLKQEGINLNLAPVADLNVNPQNPAIGKLQRSFGADPQQVSADLGVAIKAYRAAQVLCSLKHFPGLGSAVINSDYGITDVSSSWSKTELLPYKQLIAANSACDFIMTSHLINRQLDSSGIPASLSRAIVNGVLVKKFGFKGVIMTDDMDAAAIRKFFPPELAIERAVLAGNNIILYGGTQGYDPYQDAKMLHDILIKLAHKSPALRAEITKSYQKIVKLKSGYFSPALRMTAKTKP